jgi:hypothetical protein
MEGAGGCTPYVMHDLRIMVYSWLEYFILNTKPRDYVFS